VAGEQAHDSKRGVRADPLPRGGRAFHRLLAAVVAAALLALCLLPPAPAHAQKLEDGRLVLSEADVWGHAEALLAEGEYFRAVTEYKRLLYFFPAGRHVAAARQRIGEALLRGGEARAAGEHFGQLLAGAAPGERDAALYGRALARLELGRDQPYRLRVPAIAAGLADLRAISPGSPEKARVEGFARALEAPADVPSRSPWLAGGLSAVLPGAGSLYVGRYAEASLAFFANALLIATTVTAFQEHQPALGAVTGVAALAFYGGAIYAAANGAQKFNDRAQDAYLERQRERFGLLVTPSGIAAGFEQKF
jgi:tetratricopeptide (TPR) repeat protein